MRQLALVATIGLATFLRLRHLFSRGLHMDEYITVARITQFDTAGEFFKFGSWTKQAVYYSALKLLENLITIDHFVIRSISAIAGILTVIVGYDLARRLFDHKIGLTTAVLLALSPYHIKISQLGRVYSMAILLCVLIPYAWIRAREAAHPIARRFWHTSWIVAGVVALYLHTLAGVQYGIFLSCLVLYALINQRPRDLILPLVAAGVAALCYQPYFDIMRRTVKGSVGLGWLPPFKLALVTDTLAEISWEQLTPIGFGLMLCYALQLARGKSWRKGALPVAI